MSFVHLMSQRLIIISFLFHPTPHILFMPQQDPMEHHLPPMPPTELPVINSDLGGLFCNNCGRFTPFVPCKSNKNENKGVPFAISWVLMFKYYSVVALTRKVNHAIFSEGHRNCQPTFTVPSLPSAVLAPVSQGAGKCLIMGGCSSKKHKTPAIPAHTPLLVVPPQAPLVLPPPPFVIPHRLSPPPASTPLLTLPESSQPPLSEIVDARPDPRFTSHLHPIFTETLAQQHELREQKRKLDSERQAHAKRTKERIAVYAWTMDDTPPIVHVVQSGFIWPYFVISSALLTTLGLLEAGKQGDLQLYDEMDFADWVAVEIGHTVEVQEGHRLFLKYHSLCKCIDLQKCLNTPSQGSKPHLHLNLPHEHAYVREMLNASPSTSSQPQTSSPSSPLLLHETTHDEHSPLSPSSSPPPSAEEVSRADTGSLNNPIIVGDGNERRWPSDYHVVDIAGCLRECSGRTSLKKN
ncbi:uncharacterized protein LACBIDRAFT_329487 [Laccaria bicolor S238N-H82]|uniref:Predicted protein n=1 Tax=Laccaria bicolor (strain S238N-H82 / ATCC MYA-4686) TaxID=486041 RepID=B0DI66_LACBS|nr:uncharacterized protein LACBIDRAFT_329487 [Laccaria bicolor S238N-H82]EDR05526.1 predicted protein [Laccaria bicolor S238N-H82]|eukprot:XP_001883630.1 predicted protein [Laccaria bicolor S238N-H82]